MKWMLLFTMIIGTACSDNPVKSADNPMEGALLTVDYTDGVPDRSMSRAWARQRVLWSFTDSTYQLEVHIIEREPDRQWRLPPNKSLIYYDRGTYEFVEETIYEVVIRLRRESGRQFNWETGEDYELLPKSWTNRFEKEIGELHLGNFSYRVTTMEEYQSLRDFL